MTAAASPIAAPALTVQWARDASGTDATYHRVGRAQWRDGLYVLGTTARCGYRPPITWIPWLETRGAAEPPTAQRCPTCAGLEEA